MNIEINLKGLLDIINLKFGVYNPLNKFCSKKDFISISENLYLTNNKFFPFPIFLNINSRVYQKIKNHDFLDLYYNKKKICILAINSYYKLDKEKIIKKVYSTNNIKHPEIQSFLKSGDYFIDGIIDDFNLSIMKKINFSMPDQIKKQIKLKKLKTVAGFHTRNIPHKAHEWIHKYALDKCDGLIIQPMIGQYKKGEYKQEYLIQANKKLISFYENKKIIFAIFNSYPRYAGPRETLLHSIVRKNYGCTHFLVGRDHAGLKNFYSKYQSQNLCKKYANELNVNFITFNEPFLCSNCKIIINKKCFKCNKLKKTFVSGTKIRNYILSGKKIPNYFMRKEISSILKKKVII